jgi:hypothetical protein
MKRVLLVEPDYYTRFPPLGLLKLATFFRHNKNDIGLIRGCGEPGFVPDEIYVTSLFTYAWKPVHEAVKYYKRKYPKARVVLGGIYASLLPQHASKSGADVIHKGIFEEAETCVPAWDLVPEWDGSIIFTSRGCIRTCLFCSVPRLEGHLRSVIYSIKPYVYPSHTRVIFWDNNILATNNWEFIFQELKEINKEVDFNQGLDARLINVNVAEKIAQLRIKFVRLAYDTKAMKNPISKAITHLADAGIRKKSIIVYTLYNFDDDPEDFKERVTELLAQGVVSYPMRYEPITSLRKNHHVSKKWSIEELEMVAKARRVLGFAGAFPPYEGLVKKFSRARDFHEAFSLWKARKRKKARSKVARWAGGLDWRKLTHMYVQHVPTEKSKM